MEALHKYLLPVTYCIITVVGVVGNTAVLVVFALNRRLRDSTNTLIVNLAAADLLFLVLCVPFTVYSYAEPQWPLADSICCLSIYLQYVTAYASVWTLVVLALDRFLVPFLCHYFFMGNRVRFQTPFLIQAVVYPVSAMQLRNVTNASIACGVVWISVFVFNLPLLRNVGVFYYEYEGQDLSICVDSIAIANGSATKTEVLFFYISFNVVAYALPLGITCIFYLKMIRRLWRRSTDVKMSKESFRLKRRATTLVWVVIITFAFCWAPQNLRFTLKALSYPDAIFWEYNNTSLFIVQATAQIMAYANSCINPILYGAMSERFRSGFRHVCHMLCGRMSDTRNYASEYSSHLLEINTPRPRPCSPLVLPRRIASLDLDWRSALLKADEEVGGGAMKTRARSELRTSFNLVGDCNSDCIAVAV